MAAIAVGYGAVAGAVAALTYLLMGWVEHLVWSVSEARWYVPVAIMIGGVLLALLRRGADERDIDQQLAEASDPTHLHRRKTAIVAVIAIVAVGFGGSIGPEAGLLAVVAELSVIVSRLIAKNHAEEQLVGAAGSAAALSGLYGSPPGAAAYDDDTLSPPKALPFVAAVAGFLGFFATVQALGSGRHPLRLPDYAGFTPTDLVLSLVPALLAAVVATGYAFLRPALTAGLGRLGSVSVQTLVGSALFAALAAAWPLLRFSGHTDFGEVVRLAQESAWLALAALTLLKLLATALCVASGWLGGEFFPLMFSGAAAGAASLVIVPELPVTAAIAAGVGAATAIGLRKPLAALLISALLLGGAAVGPLMVGCGVAVVVVWLVPLPKAAKH